MKTTKEIISEMPIAKINLTYDKKGNVKGFKQRNLKILDKKWFSEEEIRKAIYNNTVKSFNDLPISLNEHFMVQRDSLLRELFGGD